MKTILIAHNYSKDSFSAMSYHLAHFLAKNGFCIIFISHKPYFKEPVYIKKESGEIHVFSWPTQKRPTSIKDLFWYIKIYLKYTPDLVIGHFVGSNISVLISKIFSFSRTKSMVYYHTLSSQIHGDSSNRFLKRKFLDFRKKLFYSHFTDIIICPSLLSKEDLKTNFEINNSVVILNPMMDRFLQKPLLRKDKIVISYLGRLDSTKGVLEMVLAFEKYMTDFPNSKIELQIAGIGKLTQEIKDYDYKIRNLKYIGSLKYEEVDDYLINSHFTIIPSLFDNLPTVGLESIMNQTPLLISNSTGLTPFLTDGIDCFKFDPTIDSLIDVFKRVEIQNEKINEMGINARKLYSNFFSMSTYCEKMEQQIKSILN